MWLKKLVGASMIITLIGMNAIVQTGFFGPDKSKDNFALTQGASSPPSVTLKANPTETTAGMPAGNSATSRPMPNAGIAPSASGRKA